MADNDPPNNNALTALVSSFTEEQRALYDQASAAAPRAPAAPAPAPASAPASAPGTAQRTYTLEEIASFGRALGLGAPSATSAPPAVPTGPPITSRGAPPPTGTLTDDTPIMSMSESDRKALASKIGDVKFAERMLREMQATRHRVRLRGS